MHILEASDADLDAAMQVKCEAFDEDDDASRMATLPGLSPPTAHRLHTPYPIAPDAM